MYMCICVLARSGVDHVYGCVCVVCVHVRVHVKGRGGCRESFLLAPLPYLLGKGLSIKPRLSMKPRIYGYADSW